MAGEASTNHDAYEFEHDLHWDQPASDFVSTFTVGTKCIIITRSESGCAENIFLHFFFIRPISETFEDSFSEVKKKKLKKKKVLFFFSILGCFKKSHNRAVVLIWLVFEILSEASRSR
jgi:hypothetical protein